MCASDGGRAADGVRASDGGRAAEDSSDGRRRHTRPAPVSSQVHINSDTSISYLDLFVGSYPDSNSKPWDYGDYCLKWRD